MSNTSQTELKPFELPTLWKLIVGILMVASGIVAYVFNPFRQEIKQLQKEIPNFSTIDSGVELNNRVDSFFVERGWTYLKLDDTVKIAIPASGNQQYLNSFIGDNVSIGQRILKNRNSDTIRLITRDQNFLFVIGRIINSE